MNIHQCHKHGYLWHEQVFLAVRKLLVHALNIAPEKRQKNVLKMDAKLTSMFPIPMTMIFHTLVQDLFMIVLNVHLGLNVYILTFIALSTK